VFALLAFCAGPAVWGQTQSGAGSGIITLEAGPEVITTVRTAIGLTTRIALPEEATAAICGDLFDASSNTGSFVIDRSGNDVFIKPMAPKAASNLFIKTKSITYNFDIVVVTTAQAYRVVNINSRRTSANTAAIEQELGVRRAQLEQEMDRKLGERKRQLEQESAATLASEKQRLSDEAERNAVDLAVRRLVDGIMRGLNGVQVRDRRAQVGDFQVELDPTGYTFEGKLYVRYFVTNRAGTQLVYPEPRIVLRTASSERPIQSVTYAQRGDLRVGPGATVTGVIVYQPPALKRGERVVFVIRLDAERAIQLRIAEQQ
jgi:hypothetical protein